MSSSAPRAPATWYSHALLLKLRPSWVRASWTDLHAYSVVISSTSPNYLNSILVVVLQRCSFLWCYLQENFTTIFVFLTYIPFAAFPQQLTCWRGLVPRPSLFPGPGVSPDVQVSLTLESAPIGHYLSDFTNTNWEAFHQ